MSHRHFIFHDKGGKRWPRLRFTLLISSLLALLAVIGFVVSLELPIELPRVRDFKELKRELHSLQTQLPSPPAGAPDPTLAKFLAQRPAIPPRHKASGSSTIRAAFLSSFDAKGLHSLQVHANQLTHVCPEWLKLTSLDGTLTEEDEVDIAGLSMLPNLAVLPTLTNLEENDWQPEAVESLALAAKTKRLAFARHLAGRLAEVQADGVVIDWEQLDPSYRMQLTRFLGEIADTLHEQNLKLWLSVPMGEEMNQFDLDALSTKVDHFVALLIDETSEDEAAGPIASQDWFEGWLNVIMRFGQPGQWIAAIGNYGYDWAANSARAQTISFADAMSRADNSGVESAESNAPVLNPNYAYDDKKVAHSVWFLDATTFLNQWRSAQDFGLGGFALDRLGSEDPSLWQALPIAAKSPLASADLAPLAELKSADTITSVGRGGIVTVQLNQADGSRELSVNGNEQVAETYRNFPTYPTLYRQGGGDSGQVAVTFDDGPDPDWTPAVLDLLKARGLKATFFLIGREAEEYPELVRRIVAEGHEIGSHSFTHSNLATTSSAQTKLELNATQRLLESITGRSTLLFRPPYNADAEPVDIHDLTAINIAGDLNYLTVLEDIDPDDWARPGADAIVQRVKDLRTKGNLILLHDGGGNREQTLAALPRILDYLQERGDQIVTVSQLLGMSRDEVMPPLDPKKSPMALFASGLGFHIVRWLEAAMWAFLIFATLLVTLRTGLVVWLALQHRRSQRHEDSPDFAPPLTVLIPAHNEGTVILQTVRSVLRTDYAGELQVLVIDDGSTDATAALVEAIDDARLTVIRQTNGGKAAALRTGLAAARHELLVLMDADTQFRLETLRKLIQPLIDPQIGAVSGHARVGNLRSFISRCQDLEYACGFNLDRRAYAEWNCITVVPGAVSAFRKSAILEAGGFSTDTLAEDTDLTLAIHRAGYRIEYAPEAIALTEAPETIQTLAKQRFRWAFGTLQCVWKHRDLTFNPKYRALAWFSLPGIWFFQFVLVAVAPLIDLLFFQSLFFGNGGAILPYFVVFLGIDLLIAALACHLERLPWTRALRIIPQRFLYRPLLSYVVWKAILKALQGAWVGWGKLQRTGSVTES